MIFLCKLGLTIFSQGTMPCQGLSKKIQHIQGSLIEKPRKKFIKRYINYANSGLLCDKA